MDPKITKALLMAAQNPTMTLEGGVTELVRFVIGKAAADPDSVTAYDIGNVLAGAAKALETGNDTGVDHVLDEMGAFLRETEE